MVRNVSAAGCVLKSARAKRYGLQHQVSKNMIQENAAIVDCVNQLANLVQSNLTIPRLHANVPKGDFIQNPIFHWVHFINLQNRNYCEKSEGNIII
jgi:hypothetical protein